MWYSKSKIIQITERPAKKYRGGVKDALISKINTRTMYKCHTEQKEIGAIN